MIKLDLNLFHYFWVVAREGSVTAAAKRLGLTQSTVSIQLKRLEEAVGRKLLIRSREGAVPTAEGALVLAHCDRIFPQGEDLLSLLQEGGGTRVQAFRLGVARTISHTRVATLLGELRATLPGASLKVFTGIQDDLSGRLLRGALDLVMADADPTAWTGPKLRSRLVVRQPLDFLAAPALKARMGRFPEGLGRIPLILRAPGDPVRDDTDSFLRRHRIPPIIQAEVESPDLLLMMLRAGEGAGLLPRYLAAPEVESGTLVRLNPTSTGLERRLWLVAPRRRGAGDLNADVADRLFAAFDSTARRPSQ